jgi:uncharacterized protein (DUF1919 family)
MNIVHALMYLVPAAKYHFEGEEQTYETLVWDDLFYPKPTLADIETAYKYGMSITDVDYRVERRKHYPTAEEQLAFIFEHGFDAWKDRIANIKDNIQKPEIK